jgi:hypothetical protein
MCKYMVNISHRAERSPTGNQKMTGGLPDRSREPALLLIYLNSV